MVDWELEVMHDKSELVRFKLYVDDEDAAAVADVTDGDDMMRLFTSAESLGSSCEEFGRSCKHKRHNF